MELKHLHHLENLFLQDNNITELPDFYFPKIQVLKLNNNKIERIPADFTKQLQLKELSLHGNNIKDFPKDILYLPKLNHESRTELDEIYKKSVDYINDKVKDDVFLDLTNENLTNIPEPVGRLNLQTLILAWNKINQISSNLWKLTSLTHLDLSQNSLTSISWEIVLLKDLVELNLSKNKLTSLPNELIYLKNLKVLKLFGNPLTDKFPDFSKSSLCDDSKEEVMDIKCQIQRNKIVDHLFATEKHYFSYMSILLNHFIGPLKMKKKQPINDELQKKYFSDVKIVLGISKEFLISIEEGLKERDLFDLGVTFLSYGSSFKLLSKYINEAPLNINSMKETMKTNPKFKAYIEKATTEYNNNHRDNQINFFDLYNLPVSRIQNYHQIIKKYESETPKHHKNYESVQLAVSLFDELTEYCKIKSIEAENLTKMRKVAKELNDLVRSRISLNFSQTILIASRTLLEEFSNASVVEEDDDPMFRQLKSIKIYSFNDLIVIIEKGKKGMKFPAHLVFLEQSKDSNLHLTKFLSENIKLESGSYTKTIVFHDQHDAQRFYSLWFTSAEKFWLHVLQNNESNAKGNIAMFSPRKSFILLSPRKSLNLPGGLDALKEELEKFDKEQEEDQKFQMTKSTSFVQKNESSPSNGFYRNQSVNAFKTTSNKKVTKLVSEKLKKVTENVDSSYAGIETVDSNNTPNITPSISQHVSPVGDSSLTPRSPRGYSDRKLDSPPFSEELKVSPTSEPMRKSTDETGGTTETTETLLSMSPDEENAFSYIVSPRNDSVLSSPVPKLKLSHVDDPEVIKDVNSPINSARGDDSLSPMTSPVFSSPRVSIQKLTAQYKFDSRVVDEVDSTLINLQNKMMIHVGEGEYDEAKKIIDLMKGIKEKFSKGDKKNLETVLKKAKKAE